MAFQITQDQAQDVKGMLKEFFFWMRENNLSRVVFERSDKKLKIEFDNPTAATSEHSDFTQWLGGECPVVSATAYVECKLRDGRVFANIASDVSWKHSTATSSVDVIGYRSI